MGVARTIGALRARVDAWRADGCTIGLVPTMGALHAGHLSLVSKAARLCTRTVASIFVNPAQFAAHEDLARYPRDEARDLESLRGIGCDLAYAPAPADIYPAGFQTAVAVADLSTHLCGGARPHFFGGVATIVCKLLNQCRPDVAVFGEKDFQQLAVIKRMVKDLDMPVKIIGAPTVREADGLAMSSRNAYLDPEEREIAGRLNKIIADVAQRAGAGAPVAAALADGKEKLAEAGFTAIDYLDLCAEADLAPLGPGPLSAAAARVFVAVRLGKTRLIDNWKVERAGD